MGFKLTVSGYPKFSARPIGETVRQIPKSFRGVRTCLRSCLTMPSLVGLGFHPPPERPKTLSFFCLSVCLYVTLLNVRGCAPDFAIKALEYRNDFDAVGQGKVRSCALVFNFLRLLPIGDTTKCQSPKNGKNWGFSPTEGDRINRSRRNLARKRIPRVCYSTPHLALIGKRGLVQEPPKMSK